MEFHSEIKLTYLDSNVLLAAFQGDKTSSDVAMGILSDESREFIISNFLKLETLPKPSFHNREEEVEFLNLFFDEASCIETSKEHVEHAIVLASKYDLTPIDALHIASAINANVDEFITLEKPTKPMFKVEGLNLVSIHQ